MNEPREPEESSVLVDATPAALPDPIVERPRGGRSLAWLVVLAAVVFAGWLAWSGWRDRGVSVTVLAPEGHGLRVGDDVRCRGIRVGVVRGMALAIDATDVRIDVELERDAAPLLTRAGSRYWIVHPEVSWNRVAGLDTVVGARYLEVVPGREGTAFASRRFRALAGEPLVGEPGQSGGDGLQIVLTGARRGAVAPGSGVFYREMRVGTVLDARLASDARRVEWDVRIDEPFVELVRIDSRFTRSGGFDMSLGLGGVEARVESLEQLVSGGVALWTPTDPGAPATPGARFDVVDGALEDWTRWTPRVAVGAGRAASGTPRPLRVRANVTWQPEGWFKSRRTTEGWALVTDRGVYVPRELGAVPDDAIDARGRLMVGGISVDIGTDDVTPVARLDPEPFANLLPIASPPARVLQALEPCLVHVGREPMPLRPDELIVRGDRVRFGDGIPVGDDWLGAPVTAASDGAVLGLVRLDDEGAWIEPLPDAG